MTQAQPEWYKSAVFYELSVRTFQDGNGDGKGDFPGLTSRLDYLKNLGVDCLWLLPWFPSPLRDDGYDVADYRDIHPDLGTLDDFKVFLREAHARGLRVIGDLVTNHTSSDHPWFQAARRGPTLPDGSPNEYHDYYVWSGEGKEYADTRIIFTDTEVSNWTLDEQADKYYWHRFFASQPDLNYDNPRVVEELHDAARFWLDLGLDGFRVDAVPYLIEREGTNCENLPETHDILRGFRAMVDREYPGRLLLAEANQWPEEVVEYFGTEAEPEFHMCFNFPVMPRLYMSLKKEDTTSIREIMGRLPEIPSFGQWCTFLRNHDELTLEMVTDEERAFMYAAYAPDTRMKINVGIRRRLAPLLDNDRRRIELLNTVLLALPGSPILYYGDEIGMGDDLGLPDRNGVRTPMQWNAGTSGGFSTAQPQGCFFPPIQDPVYGFQRVNVQSQQQDPSSLLKWTARQLELRRAHPAFAHGDLNFIETGNPAILAFTRQHDGETLLIVSNFAGNAQAATLDLAAYVGRAPVTLAGASPLAVVPEGGQYPIVMGKYDYYWLRLN
ncbi:maltose alpha-D-glucosyltransferase [Deinococcus wulumuqiensis]|uniref:maltose alpha-D-glucosyltransferase n=1 Tax=Deinococcus wulumuqiensis TaxID=980427 RepID=A0AAV4K8C4_9DEIO|nr:maltose alpha-D-glucosyltransferase [Deinococcus wulumuqiensis]QII19499.1 maltose alpha-D-glucosyltransferase [Deinococcus wulumuqiensis R12]GGI93144.1 trehalose synthase [Deinococcus wulumuqiensis]GGP31226.1 trehalose synthase [Deinococcus wulumuqiensis]